MSVASRLTVFNTDKDLPLHFSKGKKTMALLTLCIVLIIRHYVRKAVRSTAGMLTPGGKPAPSRPETPAQN